MNLKEMGKRIRKRREKLGLKQVDVANALQVSAQAISKWERGENAPDLTSLLDLAKLFDATTDWILGGAQSNRDTFEATIFCTSINGFAKRSAELPPRDIAAWANAVHQTVTAGVLRQEGIPVKYVGDGFLSFFTGVKHAQRAHDAAQHVRRINPHPDLVISLHSGEIYLGSIGHRDYASSDIIGETVNTAFLVMAWVADNVKTKFGLTQQVVDQLDAFEKNKSTDVKIKGREGGVVICE